MSNNELNELNNAFSRFIGGLALYEIADTINLLYLNDALATSFGCDKSELTAPPISLVYAEDVPILQRALAKSLKDNTPINIQLRVQLKDNPRWVRLHAVRIPYVGTSHPVYLAVFIDITREMTEERDMLTKLLCATSLEATVNKYLEQHFPTPSVMFVIDVDDFRVVNELLGKKTGDDILTALGQRISDIFRDGDIIGRMGGDEFTVFLPTVSNNDFVLKRAKQLCNQLQMTFSRGSTLLKITCSVGVAFTKENFSNSFADLYERAFNARKRARKDGINQWRLSTQ